MNRSRSRTEPTEDERELDDIIDELYALRPDAFTPARDDEIRKARAAGRQQLVRELKGLRRPTQSAWLVNLLWRENRDVLEQLFDLADGLRRAHIRGSGAEVRDLTGQRRELEAALIGHARTLAEKAGVKFNATTAREVQETLGAALTRVDVAEAVRAGRLIKPAAYAGFGSNLSAVPSSEAEQQSAVRDTDRFASTRSRQPKTDEQEWQATKRTRQRHEEAERRVREARAAVEAAASALADRGNAAEAAYQQLQETSAQIEQLQEQMRELKEQASAAKSAADFAARQRDRAKQEHDEALRTLRRAEQQLK